MSHSEEVKQKARELHAQGLSQHEVGRRLGVPQQTVCRWVNPEAAERNRERNRQRYQENHEAAERQRENARRWAQKNPERRRENLRRWQQENPEYSRRWRQENPEYGRQWYQENRERHRESSRRWNQENPEKRREYSSFRRAAQRQATPPWLTEQQRKQMTTLHAKARRLEKRTGVQHHVDHIIPLHAKFDVRGEQIACGLHVPWNLKVMPGPENCSKNCKLPDAEHWTAPAPCGTIEKFSGEP